MTTGLIINAAFLTELEELEGLKKFLTEKGKR